MTNNNPYIKLYDEVMLNPELEITEKYIYSYALSWGIEGCYASNRFFAERLKLTERRISQIIKSLVDKGYLSSTMISRRKRKLIVRKNLLLNGGQTNITETQEVPKVEQQIDHIEETTGTAFCLETHIMNLVENKKLNINVNTNSRLRDLIENLNLRGKSYKEVNNILYAYSEGAKL